MGGLEPVHSRHPHVEQHQRRLVLVDDGQRLFATRHAGDPSEALCRRHHVAGGFEEDRLIVYRQNPDPVLRGCFHSLRHQRFRTTAEAGTVIGRAPTPIIRLG